VGKTTVLDELVLILQAAGLTVLRTKEPSSAFDLSNEQAHTGLDLARLLADDRAEHVAGTIVPGLAEHDVVITDRYIASMLIFQVLDGVPFEQVWAMNEDFPLPDLNFVMTASEDTINRRLDHRDVQTRFDRQHHAARELAQYRTVAGFLTGLGVRIVKIANDDDVTLAVTATAMAEPIIDEIGRRP
jgi:dTMP kinase